MLNPGYEDPMPGKLVFTPECMFFSPHNKSNPSGQASWTCSNNTDFSILDWLTFSCAEALALLFSAQTKIWKFLPLPNEKKIFDPERGIFCLRVLWFMPPLKSYKKRMETLKIASIDLEVFCHSSLISPATVSKRLEKQNMFKYFLMKEIMHSYAKSRKSRKEHSTYRVLYSPQAINSFYMNDEFWNTNDREKMEFRCSRQIV